MPPCFLSEIPTLDRAPWRSTPTCLTPVRIQTKSGECHAQCAPASHWSHREDCPSTRPASPSALMKRRRILLILFTSRNESFLVKRTLTLRGYIKMVETFSSYQRMLRNNPAEASCLSDDIQSRWVARRVKKGAASKPSLLTILCLFRLMSAMKVSSPDTELTVVIKYFYWFARKPSSHWWSPGKVSKRLTNNISI